jgi:cold shock CspA family protein
VQNWPRGIKSLGLLIFQERVMNGRIFRLESDKPYGFVAIDEKGKTISIYFQLKNSAGREQLHYGTPVSFETIATIRGLEAIDVKPLPVKESEDAII